MGSHDTESSQRTQVSELPVAGPVRHRAFAASPLLLTDLLPLESQAASFRGDADTLLVFITISPPQPWPLEPYKLEAPGCVC